MYKKEYVSVNATFEKDGSIVPNSIFWTDGKVFNIDRIINICNCASLKVGGSGIRYTCIISNKQTYLFLEKDKWFVEVEEHKKNTCK